MEKRGNGGRPSAEVEVVAKPSRRRHTAEYKLRILREAEACSRPGGVGALLRREGLYSSSLTEWRKQRDRGAFAGLAEKKRGPLRKEKNPLADKVRALIGAGECAAQGAGRAGRGFGGDSKKIQRSWGSSWTARGSRTGPINEVLDLPAS
jgi:transposase-like protein